jgi:methionyl aminopeptidase
MKGRNDPCFCGSGKKYKRCHLPVKEPQWRVIDKMMKQAEAMAAMLPAYDETKE